MEQDQKAQNKTYTREDFDEQFDVSRETSERIANFDRVLLDTQAHTNLIARSTITDRWWRHFADSAQLFQWIPPNAKTLIDLGSGAGFPGLILAAMGIDRDLQVTLVESTGKKAAFLRRAAAEMDLTNVEIEQGRIESSSFSRPDVITARALAGLDKLLGYAAPIAGPNTLCIFPKGQDVEFELTVATKSWHIDVERRPSMTSPDATILLLRERQQNNPNAKNGPRHTFKKDTGR